MKFGTRRGIYVDIGRELEGAKDSLAPRELEHFETFDLIFRSLCALMFNYVPTSGHPGGSISSGRIAAGIAFDALAYDVSDPNRADADLVAYAAGHKALGLYALSALRNEVMRLGAPQLLPPDINLQLRLEDLLGFRRNPVMETPLFKKFKVKPLDGHPTPATPFVRLSTGASGVGISTALGLAYGAKDYYGEQAPYVHIIEGEGGLTPGRVAEALAAAGTASLKNAVLHVDWNQASIDSNRVCREGSEPGDYVQWTPMELCYLHDWNVIYVSDGMDFQQVLAAQRRAQAMGNHQPTAIVYRTTKGWQYGIEGRSSHGAGHGLCSEGFFGVLSDLMEHTQTPLPHCTGEQRCRAGKETGILEGCFWEALTALRGVMESQPEMVETLARRLVQARETLEGKKRKPRSNPPRIQDLYKKAEEEGEGIPEPLKLAPNTSATLREELGKVIHYLNQAGNGAIFVASADLLGSTSVSTGAKGFPEGFYHSVDNPEARTLSLGGICEDAMAGIISGLGTFGQHIGVASSYGAFIAPLGHIPARLHAIGNQTRQTVAPGPYNPMVLICAHAGVKTGEDGPTHADPQPLQLLQENFPLGTLVTLTPWDPQEMWTLMAVAINKRPAVIAPFVTRPSEKVYDRKAMGLAPVTAAATGVYQLKAASGKGDGTLVLQGSEVAYAFVEEALPLLKEKGVDLKVYYVASAELFDLLPEEEREGIFSARDGAEAMGITGFTLPTLYRWVTSEKGRRHSLYPFRKGHFLGSGSARMVMAEAELDGESQFKAIMRLLEKK